MTGTEKVLVYEYRAGRKDEQPQIMTVSEVDEKVRKSCGSIQKTVMDITGKSVVTVRENDLRTPEQQAAWSSKPNSEANVASVTIPFMTRLAGKLTGRYTDLVILSAAKVVEGK
ncbi:uncharacterized protein LTR77_004194 [Saxophila tyrrhenica]|uniref:Uncharacterized protein n=1 Tax=Saxophila tyrrhenica TaxID=1690608 RepID=A0AAV9PGC3_9PEZI|nr:hypothetical protein LTR77_004194 [Saxophila tyrrhenica]